MNTVSMMDIGGIAGAVVVLAIIGIVFYMRAVKH